MRLKIEMQLKKWSGSIQNIVANPAMLLPALPAFLIIAAITILSYEAVDLFYKIISLSAVNQSTATRNIPSSKLVTDSASRSSLQNYSIITERNLFFSTLKAISDKQLEDGFFVSGQELASFDLKGTVAGDNSFGFIIIEERGKNKQRLYRLGDMIGSAKLIKITRNTAVIRSEGREIQLKIKATPESPLLSRPPIRETTPPLPGAVSMSKQEVAENLSDLKAIMSQAVMRPFFAEGVQEGYIISNIIPNSLYHKLGLQNGDIIIDVNSKRMQSADDIVQLVNLMQSGSNIALSLKRKGKGETINYSFH